jgi:hypothetical protein
MPDLDPALPALLALAAAIVLVLKTSPRLFPIIALVGSALEALRAMAYLNLRVPGIGAATLFALAMVVGGAGSWHKSGGKLPVTAATVVGLVGLLRVLRAYL